MTDHHDDEARLAALAAALASDLKLCRQRGIANLDLHTYKRDPKHIPTLDRVAHEYVVAMGIPAYGRIAEIRALIEDGLAAYAAQGNEPESGFIDSVFFDRSGSVPPKVPGGLFKAAKIAVGLAAKTDAEAFNTYYEAAFLRFAAFLITFVVSSRSRALAQEDTVIAGHIAGPGAAASESTTAALAGSVSEPATTTGTATDTEPAVATSTIEESPSDGVSNGIPALPITWRHSSLLRVGTVVASLVIICGLLTSVIAVATHAFGPRHPVAAATATSVPYVAGHTFTEIAGEYGSSTFTDPHLPSVTGPRIEPYEQILVSCKVFAPTIPSISPDGYWYQVVSPKWGGKYYAPATNFLNGDPAIGARKHYTDMAVPDCPSS